MRQDIAALRQLARIATQGFADEETLTQAASVIRQATGAAEAMVVYAKNEDFLVCTDAGNGAATEFTQTALWIVQRQIVELGGPVAFNLVGHRVEDFTGALSDEQREFLALSVPTCEGASEMCILQGAWDHKARATILRFMESATPSLTIILERFLNIGRSRRYGEKLSALANAAQLLAQSENLEAALTDLATAIAESTASDYLSIDVYDADSERFVLRVLSQGRFAGLSVTQVWIDSLDPDRPDARNLEVMRTRQPYLSPDVQNDEREPEAVRQFFEATLMRSMAVFPMLFQDEFLGTAAFVYYAPHTFPPEEVSFLQGFVTQAATPLKALQMHNELQRYAHELKRSADQYIGTTNMTGDIIVRLDEHGRWVLLNDAACQFFGRPREELLGAQSTDYVHPEDVTSTTQAIRGTRARKELVRGFVHRFLTAMGPRVVEWDAWPLFDEQGQYTGTQITGRDITERKRMEEALRESEERYRLLAENASDLIWAMDMNLRYTYMSPSITRMRGYTVEEIVGSSVTDTMTPDSVEAVGKAFVEEMAMERMAKKDLLRERTLEAEIYCKDGSTIWTEIKAAFLRDSGGRPVGITGVTRDITERKQMEDALAAKTKEYIDTTNLTGDVIVKVAEDGRVTLLNDAACDFFGRPREELLGAKYADHVHPDDIEPTVQVVRESAVRNELVKSFVNRMITPAGTRVVEWNGYPIFDEDGQYRGFQATGRDITERKQIEDALAAKTKEYIATTNLTGDLIARMDKHGNWVFLNDAACQFYGKPREELLGTDSRVFAHPDDLEATAQAIRGTGASKELVRGFINRQLTPMGSRVVEWNGYPIFDEDGQYAGIQITGRDVTERKQMEEALRQSEQRYRLLTENTSDLIWTVDLGLRYTYMSPAITRMRGYTPEEVVGVPVAETMTPASLEAARKSLAEQLALERMEGADPNRSTKLELEMYCKDGSTIWTEMSMVFLRDSDDKPVGILGVTRDITERKRMEEEQERLHAELEERAITDSLTGLYNHAHFFQRLAEEIERSRRYKRRFAVVMMDVDAFKHYNDSRGHQAGDDALRLIADSIRSGIRGSDLAFRYGGDEFAAILLSADSSRAQTVVNRINRHIAAGLKKMDDQAAAWLGLSAGIASFPQDATTPDELVKMADAALYNAKQLAWARGLTQPEQAIESRPYPHKLVHETQAGMLTTAAGSLATVLQDLGVSEVAAALDLRAIAALGAAAEIKDRYTHGHQERASLWAAALAEDMGLSSEQVRNIRIAGLLHDIGKVTINDGILNKPGRLTEEEFDKVKQHAPVGARIMVSEAEALQRLAAIVRYHHERFDGKGYPDGIAGQHIPLEARIMSVVDVFDAMTHERAYRKALSREEAIAEIEHGAGTQFDPEVVKAFLALLKRRSEDAAAPAQAATEDRRLATTRAGGRTNG
jgi:diguanylate cyclase (GGDEF)-like protein/PAS domain S-box-containing protein